VNFLPNEPVPPVMRIVLSFQSINAPYSLYVIASLREAVSSQVGGLLRRGAFGATPRNDIITL
jgi:hypothetical protein